MSELLMEIGITFKQILVEITFIEHDEQFQFLVSREDLPRTIKHLEIEAIL